jgi:hypothetical protein
MAQSKEFPQWKWVRARSFTVGRKSGQPTVIFIHTTEGSEGKQSAEDGAAYDAKRTDGTSTTVFCDQDTTVHCVLTTDEAHAARSHGNDVGLHIEVCGKAGQSATQWNDTASVGTLEQVALACVAFRKKYPGRFPLVNLTPAQLRAKKGGFAEHLDASKAWPEDGGTHWDPGPNFPWAKLFARIKQIEAPKETDVQLNDKIGDVANPSRTVGDVLRDLAKLRGVLVGDPKDTANAKLSTSAPLALVLALPREIAAIRAQAEGNGGNLSTVLTRLNELDTAIDAAKVELAEIKAAITAQTQQ